MAFSIKGYTDKPFRDEIYGLFGLPSDNPFVPVSVLDSAGGAYIFRTDEFINTLVEDYDSLSSTDKERVYYAALHYLASLYFRYYFPNAIPKYMSDSRSVFDKFKTVNFLEMADSLLGDAIDILSQIDSVSFTSIDQFSVVSPDTDVVTGESNA